MKQNGQAQITAPELRQQIASAGIAIEYRNGKIVTRSPGERAKSWAPSFNSSIRELETLHSIARVYGVPIAQG